MTSDPYLFKAKVQHLVIMGGVSEGEETVKGKLYPDTAVNNTFDMQAAKLVYQFGVDHAASLNMSIISRLAVPDLPMHLIEWYKNLSPESPVFSYLLSAQQLGLVGLWANLCSGKLPPRCDKLWYFRTFCGVDEEEFVSRELDQLDASVDITPYLKGT